jgi:acyl-CoA thioester hydrolase
MNEWHSVPVRVYYEDTDAQGIVYFANYLKFMERGRTEWLRMLGVEQDQLAEDHGLCFTVTKTFIQFKRPARFNDQLVVRTRLRDRRRVRFSLDQEVRLASEDTLLCSAQCVAACIDAETFKPCRIPASLDFLEGQSAITEQ